MTFSPNTSRFIQFLRKTPELIVIVATYFLVIGLILIAL